MLQLIPKTNIDFIGKRYIFFAISAALLIAGIGSLIIKKGPKWGIDFTGGTLLEIQFQNPPKLEDLRKVLTEKNIPSFEIQSVANQSIFIIRTLPETAQSDIGKQLLNAINETYSANAPTLLRKEYV